ncbi:MAG: hypothetical protein ACWA49_10525 [Ruegeria sp.]
MAPALGQGVPGLRVHPVQVVDNTGFGRPLSAFSVMVPMHWKTKGGVVWKIDNCNTSGYNFDWQATSQDESEGVGILPVVMWQSQPGGPCPQMNVSNARDFLTAVVERILPNASVLDYRQRPDLSRDLQALTSRQDYGVFAQETTVDAGEILVGFVEDGKDVRASIIAQIIMWRTTMPPAYGMPGMDIRGGISLPGFIAAAPAGRLDLRVSEAIRKTFTPGQEWTREIAKHHEILNRQARDHAGKMSDITSKTNSEISDIINKGYRDREAIRDRGHRETIESIRGVETYNDPYTGGTVQLDNTYNHAWQLRDGSYLLTDDPTFNPGVALGMDGQLLQVTP